MMKTYISFHNASNRIYEDEEHENSETDFSFWSTRNQQVNSGAPICEEYNRNAETTHLNGGLVLTFLLPIDEYILTNKLT